jgi:hypothetical protein
MVIIPSMQMATPAMSHRVGVCFRYSSDPALFARIAELVSLEHRCCPFLDFRLEWKGAEDSPSLVITGGARLKPFVADTFGNQ